MKKLIIALLLAIPFGAFAQTLKIGYVNKQEIVVLLPEYEEGLKKLEYMKGNFNAESQKMMTEYQQKVQEYQQQESTLDPAIRENRINEIGRLEQRIQEFSQHAQNNLTKAQNELLMSLNTKIDEAIQKVGAEGLFSFIIDKSMGVMPYITSQAVDATGLVKKALGL